MPWSYPRGDGGRDGAGHPRRDYAWYRAALLVWLTGPPFAVLVAAALWSGGGTPIVLLVWCIFTLPATLALLVRLGYEGSRGAGVPFHVPCRWMTA
jgi:hypothetical protein